METQGDIAVDELWIPIDDGAIEKLREIAAEGCVLCDAESEEDD